MTIYSWSWFQILVKFREILGQIRKQVVALMLMILYLFIPNKNRLGDN